VRLSWEIETRKREEKLADFFARVGTTFLAPSPTIASLSDLPLPGFSSLTAEEHRTIISCERTGRQLPPGLFFLAKKERALVKSFLSDRWPPCPPPRADQAPATVQAPKDPPHPPPNPPIDCPPLAVVRVGGSVRATLPVLPTPTRLLRAAVPTALPFLAPAGPVGAPAGLQGRAVWVTTGAVAHLAGGRAVLVAVGEGGVRVVVAPQVERWSRREVIERFTGVEGVGGAAWAVWGERGKDQGGAVVVFESQPSFYAPRAGPVAVEIKPELAAYLGEEEPSASRKTQRAVRSSLLQLGTAVVHVGWTLGNSTPAVVLPTEIIPHQETGGPPEPPSFASALSLLLAVEAHTRHLADTPDTILKINPGLALASAELVEMAGLEDRPTELIAAEYVPIQIPPTFFPGTARGLLPPRIDGARKA
jgi:hypothetical protein